MKKYVDFPPKPKRGKSSYLFYCEAQRPIVAAANPEARNKDIMTMLGQDWSKLSDKQKIPYEKKGNAEKARYVEEMKGYTPPVETTAWKCSQCVTVKAVAEFSKNQWKKGDAARCRTCIENEKPAVPTVSATGKNSDGGLAKKQANAKHNSAATNKIKCRRCKKSVKKPTKINQAFCNRCVELMRLHQKANKKKYQLSAGEGHQKQCFNCSCYYGKPVVSTRQSRRRPKSNGRYLQSNQLCNPCKRHDAKEEEDKRLDVLKAFLIYAGVKVQVPAHLTSKKAIKNAYNDFIFRYESQICDDYKLFEKWMEFEGSFTLKRTEHGFVCTITDDPQVHYSVNNSAVSHNNNVDYLLKQRATSAKKTNKKSKSMARPFFLSNISNWGCSQCFTVKEKAEFSDNQWKKGDAARCRTCVENETQAAPSVSATETDSSFSFEELFYLSLLL